MTYLDRDTLGMYRNDINNGDNDDDGPGPALMGADTLIGDDVYNHNEENLGAIKEIMLDMRTGQVAYAVLSFGGILGMGEKLFAVPWERLTLDTINQRFMLDIEKDRLKNAPGFDQDNWPDMANDDWSNEISNFYGTNSLSGYGTLAGNRPQAGAAMHSGGQQSGSLQSDGGQSGNRQSGEGSGSMSGGTSTQPGNLRR